MRPRSGVSKPAIMRRAVVLPLPEGPRRATISPFSTASETPRRTGVPPKALSSRSRVRKAMSVMGRALVAHGPVPGGHPRLAVLGDQRPVDVGGNEVMDHAARPARQAAGGGGGAGPAAGGSGAPPAPAPRSSPRTR